MNFLYRFSKNSQMSNFIKIRPVGDADEQTDKQTDIRKLTVAFGNFANAPKNYTKHVNTPVGKLWDFGMQNPGGT
jgi:hypothetical protein